MAAPSPSPPHPTSRLTPTLRLATLSDVPSIHAMIHALASFEKCADQVRATPASLAATLTFAPSKENPKPEQRVARVLLATVPKESGNADREGKGREAEGGGTEEEIAGMALYFHNYSTWTSVPGVYLEDLFIYPSHRRRGLATLLLAALGREAESLAADVHVEGSRGAVEGARLEWSCLKWNEGALRFYRSIGGVTGDEWVKVRCEGKGLGTLKEAGEKVRRGSDGVL